MSVCDACRTTVQWLCTASETFVGRAEAARQGRPVLRLQLPTGGGLPGLWCPVAAASARAAARSSPGLCDGAKGRFGCAGWILRGAQSHYRVHLRAPCRRCGWCATRPKLVGFIVGAVD